MFIHRGLHTPSTVEQHANLRHSDMTPKMISIIRDLQFDVARLTLLNQALWELIRGRLDLTDQDLEAMAQEVDLRDGVKDGQITNTPMACPNCGRVSGSKQYRCMYCGMQFEKPVMDG